MSWFRILTVTSLMAGYFLKYPAIRDLTEHALFRGVTQTAFSKLLHCLIGVFTTSVDNISLTLTYIHPEIIQMIMNAFANNSIYESLMNSFYRPYKLGLETVQSNPCSEKHSTIRILKHVERLQDLRMKMRIIRKWSRLPWISRIVILYSDFLQEIVLFNAVNYRSVKI